MAAAFFVHARCWLNRLYSAKFLGKSDEKTFRPSDVAESICAFVLDHVTNELRATLAEPCESLVDIVDCEHDAKITESVHRGCSVIFNDWRREKARELDTAVAVRRAHHGDFDALIRQSGDTSGPFAFDGGASFKFEAEFEEEINCAFEVIDYDSNVVHPFERHVTEANMRQLIRGCVRHGEPGSRSGSMRDRILLKPL